MIIKREIMHMVCNVSVLMEEVSSAQGGAVKYELLSVAC